MRWIHSKAFERVRCIHVTEVFCHRHFVFTIWILVKKSDTDHCNTWKMTFSTTRFFKCRRSNNARSRFWRCIKYSVNNLCEVFTFLDRAFFLLVMRSMSSKRMMNISMAFPVSTIDRDPSIRICLNKRKFNFHPCYDRQTDPEADMTGIWRSYISNQPDVRSKTTPKIRPSMWSLVQTEI